MFWRGMYEPAGDLDDSSKGADSRNEEIKKLRTMGPKFVNNVPLLMEIMKFGRIEDPIKQIEMERKVIDPAKILLKLKIEKE